MTAGAMMGGGGGGFAGFSFSFLLFSSFLPVVFLLVGGGVFAGAMPLPPAGLDLISASCALRDC